MEIEGHGAVVTGGASGLGAATARHLASLGADVTILDRDGCRAAELAAEIHGYSQTCDVSEEEAVAAGITSAMARFGQAPRIVVHCAGIAIPAPVLGREGKVSTPIFRRMVEVNLLGAYHVLTYGAQGMMDLPPLDTGERGVILLVGASEDGGGAGLSGYRASMGGVAALCGPAAADFAAMGIRVLTVAPGPFDTSMAADLWAGEGQGTGPTMLGAPEDFARSIATLVADPSLNGQVVRLDGAGSSPGAASP